MRKLLAGYKKFREEVYPQHREEFKELAVGQHPRALLITCSDSRIVPEWILQSEPGEVFVCRNAGNIVPAYGEVVGGVSATIEYAVVALQVRHIIVCGHTDCGVMHGLMHPDKVASMPSVARWLRFGARAYAVAYEIGKGLPGVDFITEMARQNVLAQIDNLRTHPSVAAAQVAGRLELHGWIFDIPNGLITAWNPTNGKFEEVGQDSTAPTMETLERSAG
jgi:carbonic anhydrase